MKESGEHINNVLKVVSVGQKNNKKKKSCALTEKPIALQFCLIIRRPLKVKKKPKGFTSWGNYNALVGIAN